MTSYIRNNKYSIIQVLIATTLSGPKRLIISTRYTTTGSLGSITCSTRTTQE